MARRTRLLRRCVVVQGAPRRCPRTIAATGERRGGRAPAPVTTASTEGPQRPAVAKTRGSATRTVPRQARRVPGGDRLKHPQPRSRRRKPARRNPAAGSSLLCKRSEAARPLTGPPFQPACLLVVGTAATDILGSAEHQVNSRAVSILSPRLLPGSQV